MSAAVATASSTLYRKAPKMFPNQLLVGNASNVTGVGPAPATPLLRPPKKDSAIEIMVAPSWNFKEALSLEKTFSSGIINIVFSLTNADSQDGPGTRKADRSVIKDVYLSRRSHRPGECC